MNNLRLCIPLLLHKEARLINYEALRYFKRWVAPTQRTITRRKKALPPQPKPQRSTFLEWNRESELYAFNKRLSENFDDKKLNRAFTHRSYIVQEEQKQKEIGIEDPQLDIKDNTEYILEGSKLTSEIVHKYLTESFPHVPEEGIVAFHDYLLSEEMLAKASSHIGTTDIILTEEFPVSERTLADTFFALVGVLAENNDLSHVSKFVRDFLIVALAEKDLTEIWCPTEPWNTLNDLLSKQNKMPPEPRIIATTGKNTILTVYHIGVYSNKELLGTGFGQTIEEAKNIAALDALCRIYGILESSRPIKFNKVIESL